MAEKPIECNHCQREADIIYKEIAADKVTCTKMCSQCPILSTKLHGKSHENLKSSDSEEDQKLTCSRCMTTTDDILSGDPLGCNLCYTVFKDHLIKNLLEENKLPTFIQQEIKMDKKATIHKGKSPKQCVTITYSSEIATLTSALNEALEKEHYEHAAWLRDQIKELKEKESGEQKQSS